MTILARRLMTWGMGATLFLMGIAALIVAHVILAAAGSLPGAGLLWGLSIAGGLLVSGGVVLLMGPPWLKSNRKAILVAMLGHGLAGVAGVLLASKLEMPLAASIRSAAGFELMVALLCARALLHQLAEEEA
jgi:hypothetical protein